MSVFQTASAYVALNGTKVGDLTEASVSVRSNGQLLPTADAIVKSMGAATAEVSFSRVVPVQGAAGSWAKYVYAQDVLAVVMQYGNEIWEVIGTFDEVTRKTVIASGMTDEQGRFSGGFKVI